MMDPVTSFALAANVVQFVGLGVKLVRKSAEYAVGGGSEEYKTLHGLIERLAMSSAHLHSDLETASPGSIQPGPERALHLANTECLEVSREFTAFLSEFKLDDSRRFWSSLKLAMKEMASRSKFDTLQRKVEHVRSTLILSLLIYLSSPNSRAAQHNDSQSQKIVEEAQKTTVNTVRISEKIDFLAKQISSIRVSDAAAATAVEHALQEYGVKLNDVKHRLETLLSKQDEGLMACAQQVQDLLPLLDRDTRARQSVVGSLIFSHIDTRRSQISRAHTQTYEWILKPKDNDLIVWDDFVAWLGGPKKDEIYWISGKPGSGKTTLMRELDVRVSEDVSITAWLKDRQLIRASSYIWNAGTVDQKSFHGVLRSLAHQILESDLSSVDKAIEKSRWESECSGVSRKPWTNEELKKAIKNAIEHHHESCRILLLLDGLDELEGTEDDRYEMLRFLREVASFAHVKLCVSSRPWNIFREAFSQCPQLHLEDLTKSDMSKYVTDKLQGHSGFQRLQRGNKDLDLTSFVTGEILQKAQGVFLWVRLAVRDILMVVRDGGKRRDVIRELSRMPPDLDDYFKRMMESIELRYQTDAAMILQTALCTLDYSLPGKDDSAAYPGPEFLLMHLDYLDEEMDPYFAGRDSFLALDFSSTEDEMKDLLDSLDRRLSSRCMGLLEIDQVSRQKMRAQKYLWNARIEFLHRTVRDFLFTGTARQLLDKYTSGNFDAHLFRCNTMIAPVMSMSLGFLKGFSESRFSLVACFYRQIQNRPTDDLRSHSLFDKMTGALVDQRLEYSCWYDSEPRKHSQRSVDLSAQYDPYFGAISEFLDNCSDEMSNPLSLAIVIQWKSYLDSHLTRAAVIRKQGRPLLDYAIRPVQGASNQSYFPLIVTLLELGASPEERWNESPPFWVSILLALQGAASGSKARLDTVKAGFRGRTDLTATRGDIIEAAIERYPSYYKDPRFLMLTVRLEHLKESSDQSNTYSLLDLLKILVVEEGSTDESNAILLFSDSQIEELERDLQA